MNSSESSSVGFGNISSAVLVLGTSCPIIIFGLATNSMLLFKLYQCIELRRQAVSILLTFVIGADILNSGFGPSIILLQFYDSADEKVYYINYIGCLHVLFKVTSALFQSIVQFNRVLRLWSSRHANKLVNRHTLVIIVPGVLGLAGIISMFPFISRNGIRPTENPQYDHHSVLFHVVYIGTTSGLTSVSSLILLVFYCQRYLKARSSVNSMTTLEQFTHGSSLLKHGIKCNKTHTSKLQNTSLGRKQNNLISFSKYVETTLSKSYPNIRQSTTTDRSINALSQNMSSWLGTRSLKGNNEVQHTHNNKPTSLKVRNLGDSTSSANLTNVSQVHCDVPERSNLNLLSKSKSTFLLNHEPQRYRAPLKRGRKMGRSRKSPVVLLPMSSFNEAAEADVETTESEKKPKAHSMVETDVVRGIQLNAEQQKKRQTLAKRRRLSLGNITPGMSLPYAAMFTKSNYVRKIVSTVVFVLINSFSGMHIISWFFDISGRVLTNVEYTAILLSNLMCIVNPVYNTLVSDMFLKLFRRTKRN